jgi:hypothetical protein
VPVVLVLKGPQIRRSSPFMRESTWDPEETSERDENGAEKASDV